MSNKIGLKIEVYEQVKSLELDYDKISENQGRKYQVCNEKLTTSQSFILGLKALFLIVITLGLSARFRQMWSQALKGRIIHYVDYNSIPDSVKKVSQKSQILD